MFQCFSNDVYMETDIMLVNKYVSVFNKESENPLSCISIFLDPDTEYTKCPMWANINCRLFREQRVRSGIFSHTLSIPDLWIRS